MRQQAAVGRVEDFVLNVAVDKSYWDAHEAGGGVTVRIEWPVAANNFDLYVYEGDSDPNSGDALASSQQRVSNFEQVLIGDAAGRYTIRVAAVIVQDSDFEATASFNSTPGGEGPPPRSEVVFVPTPLSFAPASIVSAHFLGAEPQVTMEREIRGFEEATDPQRIFVDWPLTTFPQIGQLSRSVDGGDSFRLLFDPACAARSRPTCGTGGGSDTENEVNLFDGTVYFSDQEGITANEAIASSINHGDTFPAHRQMGVTSAPLVDRQWVGASDIDTITVDDPTLGTREVRAFLLTRVSQVGLFLQGIDQEGRVIPQTTPQLPGNRIQGGPTRVDSSGGPGHGWIYQPFDDGEFNVAVVDGKIDDPQRNYQVPAEWQDNTTTVSEDNPQDFPWLNLDGEGNAYAVWVDSNDPDGSVYYSFSAIDDPANNPQLGGRPGTEWSPKARISPPEIDSAAFPAITGGDSGRIAVTYMGTEGMGTEDDWVGSSGDAPEGTKWHAYASIITDALVTGGGRPIVATGKVSERIAHTGSICAQGALGCADGDRSLLDLMDVGFDQDGRVGVVFMDNHSSFAERRGEDEAPFAHFAKQIAGPSLSNSNPQVDAVIPHTVSKDAAGDATWPNVAGAALLPSLDVLDTSIALEDEDVVARLSLPDASRTMMTRDLNTYNDYRGSSAPAERLQYVVRFSTPDEIYHLSMEASADGARGFFGGKLDAENDALSNGIFTLGAAYHADDIAVRGKIEEKTDHDVVELRVKASDFDLAEGTPLFSVTGFAMAGPAEELETSISNPMRTVDATPPLDVTLVDGSDESTGSPSPRASEPPTPTPSSPPSPSPQPTPSATPPDEDPSRRGRCDIVGTAGNDLIEGTSGDDVICGRGGSDVILGGGGNDVIHGGGGRDRIFGGDGHDLLRGKLGRDDITGGAGNDVLHGGKGKDFLDGRRGRDVCHGSKRDHTNRCRTP